MLKERELQRLADGTLYGSRGSVAMRRRRPGRAGVFG